VHPRIVARFHGNRDTGRLLVRECTSFETVQRWARGAAEGSSGKRASKLSPGWAPVLVGTRVELLRVGAYESAIGGWIWRDDDGFEITVEVET
jgi:hypothetical protein